MNFLKEDVIAVAKAVVEPENHATYDNYYYEYSCVYCCKTDADNASKIKHALNCPVLIAQDLLTGCE